MQDRIDNKTAAIMVAILGGAILIALSIVVAATMLDK
jgi:hypothetical protein